MSNKKLDPAVLAQFTGSEHWYRHGLVRDILFTDGAKYVADAGGAYWLIDEIAIAQRFEKAVAAEEFQVWKLTVNPDRTRAVSPARTATAAPSSRRRSPTPTSRPRASSSGSRTARSICRASIERGGLAASNIIVAINTPPEASRRPDLSGQDSRLIGPSEERERAKGAR